GRDVLRAGLHRDHQLVFGVAHGVDHDRALLLEQIRHRAGLAEAAAGLGERVPDIRARPVAVVCQRLDQDPHAARAVALVEDGFDRVRLTALAGTPGDRALDVLLWHRAFLGLADRVLQARVRVRIAAPVPRRHGDRTGELGEVLPPARVH